MLVLYRITSSYHDRQRSRHRLRFCLAHYLGCAVDDVILNRWQARIPRVMSHTAVHFSVSHSHEMWMVWIGPSPAGFDLEWVCSRPYASRIMKRYAHPEIGQWWRRRGATTRDFLAWWTAMEATIKSQEGRLMKGLSEIVLLPSNEAQGFLIDCVSDLQIKTDCNDPNYVMSWVGDSSIAQVFSPWIQVAVMASDGHQEVLSIVS